MNEQSPNGAEKMQTDMNTDDLELDSAEETVEKVKIVLKVVVIFVLFDF